MTGRIPVVLSAAGLLLAAAGGADALALARRHQIELQLGLWNQVTDVKTEVSVSGTRTTVDGSGVAGGIAYGRWLTEGLALRIGVGVMGADVSTETGIGGTATSTAVVTSILVETKLFFPRSTYGEPVRPFVRIGVGPYVGSQTSTVAGLVTATESRSETVPGGRAGAGIDFLVGRSFLVAVSAGYNLMADLDRPIGGSRNYSGPEGLIGLSFVFGRGAG